MYMKEYSIIKSRKIPEGLEKEKKSEIQNSQPLCKFTPVGINSTTAKSMKLATMMEGQTCMPAFLFIFLCIRTTFLVINATRRIQNNFIVWHLIITTPPLQETRDRRVYHVTSVR